MDKKQLREWKLQHLEVRSISYLVGELYCKTKEDYESDKFGSEYEWYPGVIGGKFVD